jgi:hypothetical protein
MEVQMAHNNVSLPNFLYRNTNLYHVPRGTWYKFYRNTNFVPLELNSSGTNFGSGTAVLYLVLILNLSK